VQAVRVETPRVEPAPRSEPAATALEARVPVGPSPAAAAVASTQVAAAASRHDAEPPSRTTPAPSLSQFLGEQHMESAPAEAAPLRHAPVRESSAVKHDENASAVAPSGSAADPTRTSPPAAPAVRTPSPLPTPAPVESRPAQATVDPVAPVAPTTKVEPQSPATSTDGQNVGVPPAPMPTRAVFAVPPGPGEQEANMSATTQPVRPRPPAESPPTPSATGSHGLAGQQESTQKPLPQAFSAPDRGQNLDLPLQRPVAPPVANPPTVEPAVKPAPAVDENVSSPEDGEARH
jgi:ribonuclease E